MDGGIDRAIQWFKFSDQTRVGMSALINPVEGISMELVQRGPVEVGDEIPSSCAGTSGMGVSVGQILRKE